MASGETEGSGSHSRGRRLREDQGQGWKSGSGSLFLACQPWAQSQQKILALGRRQKLLREQGSKKPLCACNQEASEEIKSTNWGNDVCILSFTCSQTRARAHTHTYTHTSASKWVK